MQRIRDIFRKRQSTLASSKERDSKSSQSSSRDTVEDDREESKSSLEPDSPKLQAAQHALSQQRSLPLDSSRHQLNIPLCESPESKKQRSASFGEIRPHNQQLLQQQSTLAQQQQQQAQEKAERAAASKPPSKDGSLASLEVPATSTKTRSKSFDSVSSAAHNELQLQRLRQHRGSFLEIPKWKMFVRRSSAGAGSTGSVSPPGADPFRDCVHCILLAELHKQHSSSPPSAKHSVSSDGSQDADSDNEPCRSRSVSGENMDDVSSPYNNPSPIPLLTLSAAPTDDCTSAVGEDKGSGITVISLAVPILPGSARRASVDSPYLKADTTKHSDENSFLGLLVGKTTRSRSVDIGLPVSPDAPYIVVSNERPTRIITQ